jgi:MFS family permease
MPGLVASAAVKARQLPIAQALAVGNFRVFWIGETVSLLGNQFYVMAFPWLALRLTHSGLALGTLFMTLAIPRAALMLIGGAVTDRISPKTVMMFANGVRGLVMAALAVLVSTDLIRMWQLYALAAVYGTFDAFFFPAYSALLPRVLAPEKIQAGNALLDGSSEAAQSIGPILIGSAMSLGLNVQTALALDALSFLFSLLTLLKVRLTDAPAEPSIAHTHLLQSIKAGIFYSLKQSEICVFIATMAIINLAMVGPFAIGIAILAKDQFQSATSFGFLFSAKAAGALAGSVLAGTFSATHKLRTALIVMTVNTGIGLILLGLISKLTLLGALLVVMGCINSITGVISFSVVQNMIESAMMGRVMSLLTLSRRGIAPLSYLLAGVLIPCGVHTTFVICGIITIVSNAFMLLNLPRWRSMKRMTGLETG